MSNVIEFTGTMRRPPAGAQAIGKKKTVLVTGGTSGIGFALVSRLHASGANVIVCGRDRKRLAALTDALPGIATYVCDLTVPGQVGRMLCDIEDDFGCIDALVSAAGQMTLRDFSDQASLEGISEEIELNLAAPINLIDLAMPLLRKSSSATIVFVTSGHAVATARHAPVHAATRAGLRVFARSLREQMEPLGIRVIEVVPPLVDEPAAADRTAMRTASSWAAAAIVRALQDGRSEIFVGPTRALRSLSRLASGCTDDTIAIA